MELGTHSREEQQRRNSRSRGKFWDQFFASFGSKQWLRHLRRTVARFTCGQSKWLLIPIESPSLPITSTIVDGCVGLQFGVLCTSRFSEIPIHYFHLQARISKTLRCNNPSTPRHTGCTALLFGETGPPPKVCGCHGCAFIGRLCAHDCIASTLEKSMKMSGAERCLSRYGHL